MHFFVCLLVIWISLLEIYLFKYFPVFSNWVVFLYNWFVGRLHITLSISLFQICLANVFCLRFPFIHFLLSFVSQVFKILKSPNLSMVILCCHKTSFLTLMSQSFFLMFISKSFIGLAFILKPVINLKLFCLCSMTSGLSVLFCLVYAGS